MNIAIIGGGITGLTIAYELSKHYSTITVYEKSTQLGGLAGSFSINSTCVEKYFHHIFQSDHYVLSLIHELNLTEKLLWKNSSMGIFQSNKIIPFNNFFDLLCFPELSLLDRARFGYNVWKTSKTEVSEGKLLDHITVKKWIETKWSPKIYQCFWRPLLKAKFGDAADNISAAWLWGRIHARAHSRTKGKEQLGYIQGGFTQMLEAMEKAIKSRHGIIQTHTTVQKIQSLPNDQWKIITNKGHQTVDTVVFAIPSPDIVQCFPDIPQNEKEAHNSIGYQSILCMTLVMKAPLHSTYWLNIGDNAIPYTGVISHTNFIEVTNYQNSHIVYVFNYLPQQHPWLSLSNRELFSIYEKGLIHMFPHFHRDQIQKIIVFKDPYATPIYSVHYFEKMPPILSNAKNVFYTNTSHIFPQDRNMNYSIELAQKLVGNLTDS